MKNKFKLLALISVMFLLTGCGKNNYIMNEDKIVKYEVTGQSLQKDILCLPDKDGDLYKEYEKYQDQLDIDIKNLPACEDFKVNSNKSTGLWEFLFVKPLAWAIIKLGSLVNNLGISLILIGLLIRIILLPFTIKSTKQTMNMKNAQPEIEKIERKYNGRTDNQSLMMKSQETMAVYKKYNVNPMVGCLIAFLQIPLFFAFLRAIYRTPAIYEETLFGFNLGMLPSKGIANGNYWYILLIIIIAVSTYFSFRQSLSQTSSGGSNQGNQMKIMLYVMLFMITYASLSFPTALAFYWIITYAFIAIQNIVVNKVTKKDLTKDKKIKKDKIKDKLVKKEGLKYGKNN